MIRRAAQIDDPVSALPGESSGLAAERLASQIRERGYIVTLANEVSSATTNRLRWPLGTVNPIAHHNDAGECVCETAAATGLHLERAVAMVRELNSRHEEANE